MKFSFVILNYNTFDDTEKCIDSIKKLDDSNINIIVVDNASPDNSGNALEEKYKKDELVDVVFCEENLGFAKGNNKGYLYAKEKYNPDFIVVSNSDVIFFQTNICEVIKKIYSETPFDILGPDVLDNNKQNHSNPLLLRGPSYKTTGKWLKMFRRQLFRCRIKRVSEILGLYRYLKKDKEIKKNASKEIDKSLKNVVIHGCCVIASKDYIDKKNWIFYPDTFLFNEECIMWEIAQREKTRIIFNPNPKIIHNEHSSINTVDKGIKTQIFTWKNHIKSIKILRKIQLENKKATK